MVGSCHSLGVPPAGDNPEFAIVGGEGEVLDIRELSLQLNFCFASLSEIARLIYYN